MSELLESWATQNLHIATDEKVKVPPGWRDFSFTIKYYSDALFDFPHWFGFSKRTFKVSLLLFLSVFVGVGPLLTCVFLHTSASIKAENDMNSRGLRRVSWLHFDGLCFFSNVSAGCSAGLPDRGAVYLLELQEVAYTCLCLGCLGPDFAFLLSRQRGLMRKF